MSGGTVCPLYNEYGEELRWIFTEPLGTCVYNVFDQIAFIVGWMSVASWTFALLPQIVTNCKNKAAESQSFWFWMLWLIGDVANFSGCILTHNLITNIALAFVYLTITAFACLQFVWYEYLAPMYFPNLYGKDRGNRARGHSQQLIIHSAAISPSTSAAVVHSARSLHIDVPDDCGPSRGSNARRPVGTDGALWTTPKFARPFTASNGHYGRAMSMSPRLNRTLKLLHRSPRVFAVTPQLTGAVKREYDALQAQKRENSFSRDLSVSHSHSSGQHPHRERPRHTVKYYSNRNEITPKIMPLNSVKKVSPQPTAHRPHSVLALNETRSAPKRQDESTAVLRGGMQSNYGSIGTIMSTMSSMSVTVVMLYGLNQHSTGSNDTPHGAVRELLSTEDAVSTAPISDSMAMLIGMMLGWISSVIYISSRIPQMRLMVRTKDVAGINPAFFALTFSGNLTQCLSMMINRQIYVDRADFVSKLPWLVSSSVCIFQDFSILVLIWLYRNLDVNVKTVVRKGVKTMGVDYDGDRLIPPTTAEGNRSKGVMMPAPVIPYDEEREENIKKTRGRGRSANRDSKYRAPQVGSINDVGDVNTINPNNTF